METEENSLLNISIEEYQGPLELLLELIHDNKMDIYDIPIAKITEQYLERLKEMKEMNLTVAGEFLVLAATLIYIKSKMLLPEDPNEEDEEDWIDPRSELVQKILEYQEFKEAARELDQMQSDRGKVFRRTATDYHVNADPNSARFQETLSSNLYELIQAFSKVIASKTLDEFHEIYEEDITIESRVELIQNTLMIKEQIDFEDLFSKKKTRNELVATFLAVLELIKMKEIKIIQTDQFSQIKIIKNSESPNDNEQREN